MIVNNFSRTTHPCGVPHLPLASSMIDISVPNPFFRQINRQDESAQPIAGSPYQRISIFLAPGLAQGFPACNIFGQQLFRKGCCALYLSAVQGDGVSSRWQRARAEWVVTAQQCPDVR